MTIVNTLKVFPCKMWVTLQLKFETEQRKRGPNMQKLPVMERFKWHVVCRARTHARTQDHTCFLVWRGDFCSEKQLSTETETCSRLLRATGVVFDTQSSWPHEGKTQIWVKAVRSGDENYTFKMKPSAFWSWYLAVWHISHRVWRSNRLQNRFISWCVSWTQI